MVSIVFSRSSSPPYFISSKSSGFSPPLVFTMYCFRDLTQWRRYQATCHHHMHQQQQQESRYFYPLTVFTHEAPLPDPQHHSQFLNSISLRGRSMCCPGRLGVGDGKTQLLQLFQVFLILTKGFWWWWWWWWHLRETSWCCCRIGDGRSRRRCCLSDPVG